MRLVAKPQIRPMCCAALPYLGQSSPNVRWVDTGSEMPGFDNHVYLSEPAIIEAGRVLGLPTREEHEDARARIAQLEAEKEEMQARLTSQERRLASIEVLESEGFRIRKRPGRPPAKQEEKVT
jgi:hypothetical protein